MSFFTKTGTSSLSLLLVLAMSGCGGQSTASKETKLGATSLEKQPHKIERANWVGVDPVASSPLGELQVTTDEQKISFQISNSTDTGAHTQFFIDIDNNRASGYQSRVWTDSGADYMIEDGHLYKSTANTRSWAWQYVSSVDITKTATSIEVEMNKSLLQNLNNTFKVGALSRTSSWRVDRLLPSSAQMAQYTVGDIDNPPADTIAPEIVILGEREVTIIVGDTYNDLGATANDNSDGDITNRIDTDNSVNVNVAGRYEITYTVSDDAGNEAEERRIVIVTEEDVDPDSENPISSDIVVDGLNEDWRDILTLSTQNGGEFKAHDDSEKLFLMVSASAGVHTQFYIDSDNNPSTGFRSRALGSAGADYMVEDGELYRSVTNSTAWNWQLVSRITRAMIGSVTEVSIDKATLTNLSEDIKITAVVRSRNWSVLAQLPASGMATYTTGIVIPPNHIPTANTQSVEVEEGSSLPIVLRGSDTDGDALTYRVIIAPENGLINGTVPNITYTPNAEFSGTDSFTFVANDGTEDSESARVSITVNELVIANTKAVANAQSITTEAETNVSIVLTGSDADGDVLTYSIVDAPTSGTLSGDAPNITYTPNIEFSGTDSFTFVANDGMEDSETATVSITVNDVEEPKNTRSVADGQSVVTQEGVNIDIILSGSDGDDEVLTYTIVDAPTSGTLSGDAPNVTYTPNAEFSGTDSFTFVVNDGVEDSEVAEIVIVVEDIPEFVGPFAEIQELIQSGKNGTEANVTYISVGDSTRALDNYYNGGALYTAVRAQLNPDVATALNAVAGHTLRKWNNYDGNVSINRPIWEETVALIPGDGNTTILNISLGINDARYYGIGNEKAGIKFHMDEVLGKILTAKPNTHIMLTMPHRLIGLDAKTVAVKAAYEEIAIERDLPMINTVDELFTGEDDLSLYRAEDAAEYGEGIRIHLSESGQALISDLILSKILP